MDTHKLAQHLVETAQAVGKASARVDGYKVDALRSHINMHAWRHGVSVVTYWSGGIIEVAQNPPRKFVCQ